MQLRNRKQSLLLLFERLQQYQFDIASGEGDLEEHFRTITEEDLDRLVRSDAGRKGGMEGLYM